MQPVRRFPAWMLGASEVYVLDNSKLSFTALSICRDIDKSSAND